MGCVTIASIVYLNIKMFAHHDESMRTTLSIDDDVLEAARALTRLDNRTLGEVISELARRGLRPSLRIGDRDGFPVFEVADDAPPLTPEQVRRAMEYE
jgi:hypothetical protein